MDTTMPFEQDCDVRDQIYNFAPPGIVLNIPVSANASRLRLMGGVICHAPFICISPFFL